MKSGEPDRARIDAWLAGELSPEEAREVELGLQESALLADKKAPEDDLLRDLDQDLPVVAGALADLVASVSSQDVSSQPAPDRDSWRSVLTPSENPEIAGTLGGYEVVRLIATGGMATVLEARDPKLDRIVALKVLPPELAANRDARERFLREARAAAKLEHESILPIHGVNEDENCAFFAMRYIATGSLQDALDRGDEFPIERIEKIARGVTSALGAAHSAGMVHRDIKPANILLGDSEDQIWVCDFGIARSTDDPSLSYTSTISGTPQYMSPEQAEGEELDGRSDLFALGAVLFRCASGQQAFAGKTSGAVLNKITNTTPPRLSKLNPDIPPQFSDLVAGMLEKDPSRRPADAAEVLHRLQSGPLARRRFPFRTTLIGIGLLLAGALVALRFPATKAAINHHLLAPDNSAEYFTIHNRIGVHETLAAAISAARDDEQIGLPSGLISVEKIEIPAGKRLVLRPAKSGARARITSMVPGRTAISTASSLSLIDIGFEMKADGAMAPLIVSRGAPLEFSGCHFSTPGQTLDPQFHDIPCAIWLAGGTSIEIDDSHFSASISVPIRVTGPGEFSIKFRNTKATVPSVIHLPKTESESPKKLSLTATNCDFTASKIFQQNLSRRVLVSLHALDCRLAITSYLAYFETDDPEASKKSFRWDGNGNKYPLGTPYIYYGAPPHGRDTLLVPATPHPAGSIEIVGNSEKYSTLTDAIDAAPDGATLLLSGQIDCLEEIITPEGKSLNLRAAEGASPAIRTRLRKRPAIQFRGPTSLDGIRFVRHEPLANAMPVVSIHAAGGEIEVSGCEFFVTPSNARTRYHRGLGVSDFSVAEIRQCHFRALGGYCIAAGAGSGDLRIEECFLQGLATVELRHAVGDPDLELVVERSILVCIDCIVRGATGSSTPLELELNDNIVYVMLAGIALGGARANELADLLTWRSNNNYIRAGSALLRTYKSASSRNFSPVVIVSDSERMRHFPDPASVIAIGSKFGKLFDLRDLPLHFSTPDSLRAVLDPSVDSAATETLDYFADPLTSQ